MEKKKNNLLRRSLALVLAVALVAGTFLMIPTKAADTSLLGNLIDSFTANSSVFNLSSTSRFFFTAEPTGELLQTVQLVQRQFAADELPSATPLDIVWGDIRMIKSGDILVNLVDKNAAPAGVSSDEGYMLEVGSYATVTAYGVDGLLYGLNMLHKHFRNADTNSLRGFTAIDTPDTIERTAQLDCARKYFTVEYICNFIKEMSWMGYNTLQLHFSEDGGYRADLWDPTYYVEGQYEPENDFTWLCGSNTQYWCYSYKDANGNTVDYSVDPDANRYLKTSELIEIINTCKEYHIDIIPSFDSPGHMDYLTWKFEQQHKAGAFTFYYNGTPYSSSTVNGIINYYGTGGGTEPDGRRYTCINVANNTATSFVLSIYKDMADFFKYYAGSTKFNIGADEVVLDTNTKWQYSSFPGYINKVNAVLEERGYTARMFNDFITADALAQLDDSIEILYWNSAYSSTSSSGADYYKVNTKYSGYAPIAANQYAMQSVADYVADGRTVYNCINQHTYYVLRVNANTDGGDARSENCRTWEFYGATEKAIWNDWTPNNIRKKGDYTEPDAIVADANLGGAYFLTWNDYAAVNTETEVWNGVDDFMKNTGEFYSLRWRMWSNITKMWNWDINSTLSYANFAKIRDTLGDFPGLETDTYSDASYAKATSLPAATAPIQLGDHTALTAALATKISQGYYTDASYNAYLAAYNAAVEVNNDNSATDEELTTALNNLNNAIKALTIKSYRVTIVYKANINGTETIIKTNVKNVPSTSNEYDIFVPYIEGYTFLRAENSVFTPTASGDGSGNLTGSVTADMTITLWYENAVNTSRLNALIVKSVSSQNVTSSVKYTDASWSVYTTALNNAKDFIPGVDTKQSDVDALVDALEAASTGLVTPSSDSYMEIEFLNDSFTDTQQIGLYIKTSPNIKSITVQNRTTGATESLTSCTGEVQTLDDGTVVKFWNVFFMLNQSGDIDYDVIGTYTDGNADKTISKQIP